MENQPAAAAAEKKLARSTLNVCLITFGSRMLGMLRDIGLVLFFSPVAWALDAFYFAFTIPNLFRRIFGEGALSAAFIPEMAHAQEQGEDGTRFASSVITMLVVFLGGITLLGSAVCLGLGDALGLSARNTLVVQLLAVMLPFAMLVCTSAVMSAVAHTRRHFSLPAAMSMLLNIAMIGALAMIAWQNWPTGVDLGLWQKIKAVPLRIDAAQLAYYTRYVAAGVTVSGVLQIIVLWPALAVWGVRLRPVFDFSSPRVRAVLKHMGPTALGMGIVQVNVLVDNLISYWLSTRHIDGTIPYEGATTYLFLGNRLMQLPLGVFAIAVATTAFPALSTQAAKQDGDLFCRTMFRSLKMQLFVMLPAAAGLIILNAPIIRLLYQSPDLEFSNAAVYRTGAVLCLLCAGLPFFAMQQVFTRAFYALRDYTTPVKIAASMVLLNVVLNLLLIHAPDLYRHYTGMQIQGLNMQQAWGQGSLVFDNQGLSLGEAGLALSTAICAVLNVLLLWRALRRSIQPVAGEIWQKESENLLFSGVRLLLCAAGLGVCAYLVCRSIPYGPEFIYRLERVVVPIAVSIFFYPLFCSFFAAQEYEYFMGMLRNRRKRG